MSTDMQKLKGWKYRSLRIGPITLPSYASPIAQLGLVSCVCFLCPGMFNALGGMGGGGQVNPTAANNANTALYSTFAVVGFFAGKTVDSSMLTRLKPSVQALLPTHLASRLRCPLVGLATAFMWRHSSATVTLKTKASSFLQVHSSECVLAYSGLLRAPL